MSESKKTCTTFTFKDLDDGRYGFEATGDQLDMPQTYVLWTRCMEALLEMPDLHPDKRDFIMNVYNHVMSPAEKVVSKQEKLPMRIVTIYKAPMTREFIAVEYHTLSSGAQQTGWVKRGPYAKVVKALTKDFGEMTRVARDNLDDPSVVESWV